MHELALGATSNNAFFGPVRNPYDLSRIPGGSGGGTAAAIAARNAPVGLGTDTAGSVRVPAALTGTVWRAASFTTRAAADASTSAAGHFPAGS